MIHRELRLVRRHGMDMWVAAITRNGQVVAYTTTWSEAGAKTWLTQHERFLCAST